MSVWTPFTYNTGWSDFTGFGLNGGAYKLDGDRVWFRGTITQSGLSGSFPFTIATVGANFVPYRKPVFCVACFDFSSSGAPTKLCVLSVDSSGNVNFEGPSLPDATTPGLCLDGLSYSTLA